MLDALNLLIDFHAEATSEKAAFALYVDGRASAVLGTHTHVQTADERILPEGTAFISSENRVGADLRVCPFCPLTPTLSPVGRGDSVHRAASFFSNSL